MLDHMVCCAPWLENRSSSSSTTGSWSDSTGSPVRCTRLTAPPIGGPSTCGWTRRLVTGGGQRFMGQGANRRIPDDSRSTRPGRSSLSKPGPSGDPVGAATGGPVLGQASRAARPATRRIVSRTRAARVRPVVTIAPVTKTSGGSTVSSCSTDDGLPPMCGKLRQPQTISKRRPTSGSDRSTRASSWSSTMRSDFSSRSPPDGVIGIRGRRRGPVARDGTPPARVAAG